MQAGVTHDKSIELKGLAQHLGLKLVVCTTGNPVDCIVCEQRRGTRFNAKQWCLAAVKIGSSQLHITEPTPPFCTTAFHAGRYVSAMSSAGITASKYVLEKPSTSSTEYACGQTAYMTDPIGRNVNYSMYVQYSASVWQQPACTSSGSLVDLGRMRQRVRRSA